MENIRHNSLRLDKVLNNKNRCSGSHNLSIKHNKHNKRMINVKEVIRHTYCDEFDNTINNDIQ